MQMTEEMKDQLQLFTVDNPCVGICEVNNRGYCLGCFRSRDERFYWNKLTDGDKSKVLKLCQRRRRRKETKKQEAETVTPPQNLSLF